ncbi:MAG: FecR domain-containing protein [Spirochaeta sp.]|nr:FecR domain-containing protein [Spirochaeta sp.]
MVRKLTIALIIALVTVSGVTALDATITAVNGKVELRERAGGPWVAAQAGVVVPVGATISTSFNAGATVQVGESQLEVKALTRMRIEELITENGVDRSEIDLPVGRVSANVRGSSGNRAEFRVTSPIATASVRGTSFDFDGANLSVSEGIVVLANRFNESVQVAQGEQSSAAGDGAPQKPAEAAENSGTVTISVGPSGERPVVRESTTGGLTINWRIVN